MVVYKKSDLYNRYVMEQSEEALESSLIEQDSYAKILKSHPDNLYTPNLFIRIALGLLTIVAVWFMSVLLFLIISAYSAGALMSLFIMLAIICYITLELLIHKKRYYNAGVDNVLMFYTILFIVAAFIASDPGVGLKTISAVTLVLCTFLSLRFTDAFSAMLAYVSFLILLFLEYLKIGEFGKDTAPFIMAVTSILFYFQMQRFKKIKSLYYYRWCFNAVRLLSMLSFYASLNYFVVRELSNKIFDVQYSDVNPLPFGWIFWICTFIIPLTYAAFGIFKKDFYFMRTGLVLIAMSIFTLRYYHPILFAEMAMLIAGLILIVISYGLIKWLKITRYGYTFMNLRVKKRELNLEALIIAQAFGQQPTDHSGSSGQNDLYGGGTGGGGGAGGEY